jgi:hypothetical protein
MVTVGQVEKLDEIGVAENRLGGRIGEGHCVCGWALAWLSASKPRRPEVGHVAAPLLPGPCLRVPNTAVAGECRIEESFGRDSELFECRPCKIVCQCHFGVGRRPACWWVR